MTGACASVVDAGLIRGVLDTIDCQTRAYAQGGYLALTQGSGVFQAALTAILTLYVALIGYRLLFAQGDTRLSDAPGAALRIGAILALVTSWAAFQTVVFDLADRAPVEIAAIASKPWSEDSRSALASRPIEGLEQAYDELTRTAAAFGRQAGPESKPYASPQAAAANAVSLASGALFFSSAGVISAATLAIGVLTAVGPVFVVLALIPATRGVFVGWVRALLAAALTPMVAWLLLVLMLAVIEPWLQALAEQRAALALDPRTAISAAALVFVFAAGEAVLVLGAWIMALGFRLPLSQRAARGASSAGLQERLVTAAGPSRPERLAVDLLRDQVRNAAAARAAATTPRAGGLPRDPAPVAGSGRIGDAYRRPAVASRRETVRP